MILGYRQQFPWKINKEPAPTNFREKILAGVRSQICDWTYDGVPMIHTNNGRIYCCEAPKIHTMRADPYDRWKAGRKIEMVYRGAGYKIIDHFNKGIPELEVMKGKQKCRIQYNNRITELMRPCGIYIDDKLMWEGYVHERGGNSCGVRKR